MPSRRGGGSGDKKQQEQDMAALQAILTNAIISQVQKEPAKLVQIVIYESSV